MGSNKLFFYTLSIDYYNYLKNFDHRVPQIHSGKERRPFIGIVLSVNGSNFYAPLSSPKPKHLKMKNSQDFTKIANGVLGAINFNNMIPVPMDSVAKINPNVNNTMSAEEIKYNLMLQNQLSWCNSHKLELIGKAKKLYDKYLQHTLKHDLLSRCCDFILLESKCTLWQKYTDIKSSLLEQYDIKKINDHIRHKDKGYNTEMLNNKYFVFDNDLYRIEQIDLKPLGLDTAILTKITESKEEKYLDNNFTSDAKFNLHLQKIDSKIISIIKNIKNK